MSDVIADLQRLGEETATETIPLELGGKVVRRVRARQAMTVLGSATLVAALVFGVLTAMDRLNRPARGASPTSSTSTRAAGDSQSIVFLNSQHTTWFAPAIDALPGLTSSEAIAAFEAADADAHLPADLTAELGSYTAAVGDGTYRFQDRLAWGISWHRCAERPESAPPDSVCRFWLFLDANTGEMLEATWQAG